MSDIKEGDQVSWKYGGGNPEGTVAEIKTSGELAIETNGKEVKVNASEDNPAVHIARNGNDVVKRESALTKKADATENGEPAKDDQTTPSEVEPKKDGVERNDSSKNEGSPASGDDNTTLDATQETDDKMDVTPDTAEKVEVGEKRSREEDDTGEAQSEEEQVEKENGKETKKAKLENGDAAENGHDTENGHTDTQNGHTHAENGNGVEAKTEEAAPKKARGPGRPKKGDVEAKQTVLPAGDESTIARRTRSKA